MRNVPSSSPEKGDFEKYYLRHVAMGEGCTRRVGGWRCARFIQAKGKFEDVANGAMGEVAWPIIDNQIRSRTKRMMAFIVTSR